MATSRGLTTATSIRQETVEVRSGLGPDTAAGMRTDEAGTELVIRAERPEDEAFLDRLACAVAVEGFRPRLAPTQPESSSVLILGVAVNAKKLPFARGRRQCGIGRLARPAVPHTGRANACCHPRPAMLLWDHAVSSWGCASNPPDRTALVARNAAECRMASLDRVSPDCSRGCSGPFVEAASR